MKKLKAFTLMEVLISLTLVGTIAVLTVPNVISNYNKKVNATRMERFYNQISDAFAKYKGENKTDYISAIWQDEASLTSFLGTYFNVAKSCGYDNLSNIAANGCLASSYKTLSGESVDLPEDITPVVSEPQQNGQCDNCSTKQGWQHTECTTETETKTINDESVVYCKYTYYTFTAKKHYCASIDTGATVCLGQNGGSIVIDVNGKSSPNVKGRDLFAFSYTAKGEISDDTSESCDVASSLQGCFSKLIENQWNMNY